MYKTFFIFLLLNFAALAIGGLSTNTGVNSEWYAELNKAPWTPPGWVFGAAWTTIMICFTFYMSAAWQKVRNHQFLIGLFTAQWIFNVIWNPIFFTWQQPTLGLIIISLLTAIVSYFLFHYQQVLKAKSLWIAPYFVWLLIATSLNLYIVLYN